MAACNSATERNTRLNLARQTELAARGYVARAELQQAEAAARVNQATLTAARERLRTLAPAQAAQQEAADARVKQALAQVDSARAGAVDIRSRNNAAAEAQSAVKQAEQQLARAESDLDQAEANRATNAIRKLGWVRSRPPRPSP